MASKVRGQPATGQSTTATQSPRSSPAANRQARPSSISTNNSNSTAASQHAPASATASAAATASPSPRPSSSTPAINNAASSSSTADLTSYLGLPVRLKTTTSPNPISGLLFAHDASSGLVILETGFDPSQNSNSISSSGSSSGYPSKAASAPTTRRHAAVVAAQGGSSDRRPTGFKLIKERTIKEVQVLSHNDGIYATSLSPVNVVNPMIAEKREMAATKEATLRASRIGPSGVSDLGQELFEALSKTLPCRWWEKNIVILDDVVLVSR
jgi:protein LSM12